ncbi:hypothetical protein L7F22_027085 [Adiantum nelumboides]|nr:hypothetical protein [Adiantum nelumboides]
MLWSSYIIFSTFPCISHIKVSTIGFPGIALFIKIGNLQFVVWDRNERLVLVDTGFIGDAAGTSSTSARVVLPNAKYVRSNSEDALSHGGGIQRRNAPVLKAIREEVSTEGKYCLVLVFEAKALELKDFTERQAKFTSFFGPGITADIAAGGENLYEVKLVADGGQ